MACEAIYPTDVPVDCVKDLINIVRKGEWSERAGEAYDAVYVVLGYVAGIAKDHLPKTDEDLRVMGEQTPLDDEQACVALDNILGGIAQEDADIRTVSSLPIPWALLVRWLVVQWLKRLGG